MIFAQKGSLLSSLDILVETDLSRREKPLSRNKTNKTEIKKKKRCFPLMVLFHLETGDVGHTCRKRPSGWEIPQMNDHMNLLCSPLPWYLGHCVDEGSILQLPAPCMETHTDTAWLEMSSTYLQSSMTMQPNLFRTSFEESFSPCPSHWGKIVMIWLFFGKLWRVGREWEISQGL